MKSMVKATIRTRYYQYDKVKREPTIYLREDIILMEEIPSKPLYEKIKIDNKFFKMMPGSEYYDFELLAMIFPTDIYRIADKKTMEITLNEMKEDKRWYDIFESKARINFRMQMFYSEE